MIKINGLMIKGTLSDKVYDCRVLRFVCKICKTNFNSNTKFDIAQIVK